MGGELQVLFRSQINGRDLQLKCVRIIHETLLVSVLIYGSKIVI